MARNGDAVEPIRHPNVLALVENSEAGPLERTDGAFGREIREQHLEIDDDFDNLSGMDFFTDHRKVCADGVLDIRQGVAQRLSLADASRKSWTFNMVSIFAFLHRHEIPDRKLMAVRLMHRCHSLLLQVPPLILSVAQPVVEDKSWDVIAYSKGY